MKKTEKEYQVWGRNQYGKDHLTTESTRKEAKERVKEYRENELGGAYWYKSVRVPVPGCTFKVRYTFIKFDGTEQRGETVTTYTTFEDAKKYADQLNDKNYPTTKNARVVIIPPSKKSIQ